MKKRTPRCGTISESKYARVEIVEGSLSEPLSLAEIRQAHEPRFAALAAVVGPIEANRAFEEFMAQIEAAREESARRGDVYQNVQVTRLR
jgi:hypothetical protein